jgi:flagellar biosynthetic protein FlhB
MAGESDREDRTQPASAKRLQQARDEGRAPLSREVAGLAVLAAATALVLNYLPDEMQRQAAALARLLGEAATLSPMQAAHIAMAVAFPLLWPFMAATLLAASVAVLGQTNFLLNTSALAPDFSRISLGTGLAKLFGTQTLVDAATSTAKVAVMGLIAWQELRGLESLLPQAAAWSPGTLAAQIGTRLVAVATAILTVQLAVAGVDVLRTHLRFHAALRMTHQDQRDEARDSEGDPHVKGKLKQIRLQRSKRRMLQAVPKATLVVTNPTHYAVALFYEQGKGGAPRIIAKGADEMAARIRETAKAHGVPLIANPPLARALYPLPLESEIPAEHFQAVAELIAYVWKLRLPRRGRI